MKNIFIFTEDGKLGYNITNKLQQDLITKQRIPIKGEIIKIESDRFKVKQVVWDLTNKTIDILVTQFKNHV
jgi:hypothetical protein